MTGIKHFTTKTPGTGGEIKRRVSDFIVREITPEGKTLENTAFGETSEIKTEIIVVPENPQGFEYLHLTMEKFNLDTNNALRRLTRALRCSPKRVGYAGMKDRRALTVQRVSVWKPDKELLEKFGGRFVAIREPEWREKRIEIGNLTGNEFEITIRNIELGEAELARRARECFAEMLENGVANYFGEQRFGGIREITHRVGREFILGNMEKAVMLYLTSPSEGEEEEIAIARKNLAETKDFARATKEFPAKFRYERSILHHLCRFPHDFVGAFQKLPKHLAYLFTHAYQSYLFNEIINARIEAGIGINAVEGDVLDNGVPTGALLGFDSVLAQGEPGEIERKTLEKEGIWLESFRVKSFQELSCKGARKKIVLKPINPRINLVGHDEFNEGKLKLKISFSLDKGNYATTILRELMKSP